MCSTERYLMQFLVILLFIAVQVEALETAELYEPYTRLEAKHGNKSVVKNYEGLEHPQINTTVLSHMLAHQKATDYLSDSSSVINEASMSDKDKESTGHVVFNTHHLTQFVYNDEQVYIYSPKKNDEHVLEPQKWSFYYVPVLQPIKASSDSQWAWIHKNEVRVRLSLGTVELEKAARKAIADQYDYETVEQYSKFWVVAPLMMDSLSAYIISIGSSMVEGVAPFHIDNPISNAVTLRFACITNEAAEDIALNLLEGDYDIEVSFYFAGMHTVKTNMVTITATQLQSILSKTIADGGGTNATYIHRDQATSFISKYMANVKKMVYIEDPTADMTLLTSGLEEQFTALFQEGENVLFSSIGLF